MHLLLNHLKIAFRRMRRDKVFSLVNIFGLTVGVAACVLIFQYTFFESSYDRFVNAERTFRIYTVSYENEQLRSSTALTPANLAPALAEKISSVEQVARLISTRWWFDCTLAYSERAMYRIFNETDLYYADPSVLSVFDIPLLKGDARTALEQPYSLVLSEEVAKKYFGNEDPLGKTLRLKGSNENHEYVVTAVMPDPLPNTHLSPTVLASISSIEKREDFSSADTYTYVQLTEPSGLAEFKASLDLISSNVVSQAGDIHNELNVQSVSDIHLHSDLEDDMKKPGDARSVYFLSLVAIVILVMAWINYVNLSTARAFARAREVGIRKTSGASRGQIVIQFLTETFVFNAAGMMLGTLLVYSFGPVFYQLIGVSIPPRFLFDGFGIGLSFMLLVFCTGIFISGIFPALTLSSFNPIRVLKGKLLSGNSHIIPRKIMVVFQFACTIALTVAVIAFGKQFKFMQEQDLRIDISRTVIIKSPVNVDSAYLNQLAAFKDRLKNLAIIRTITSSSSVPGSEIGWTGEVRTENGETREDFTINVIDPEFIDAYGLRLRAGRHFQPADFPGHRFGDKLEPVAINMEGLRRLGFNKAEDAINTYVYWGDDRCIIVGVVDDFHHESLKRAIRPQLFTAGMGPTLSLKLTASGNERLQQSIEHIHQAWNSFFPNNAFEYTLLEDTFEHQYAEDQKVANLFTFFCVLGLAISSLGLFGLSLFSVQRRTKEVGIRKVLGAPAGHLFRLLTQEYVFLVLVAALVALPVTAWVLDKWLSGFAFHISPGPAIFLLPVLMIALIALVTVGGHIAMVIATNPAESLKGDE